MAQYSVDGDRSVGYTDKIKEIKGKLSYQLVEECYTREQLEKAIEKNADYISAKNV